MSREKDLSREFMTLKFENYPVAVYIGYMSALDILSLKRTKRHLRIRELFFFKKSTLSEKTNQIKKNKNSICQFYIASESAQKVP